MDAVKSFNQELSSLYEVKPPISKAKMTALTRGAIKAIKFYKHVVQSVEKFILKCKPDYKVPGLYVIDSIVRQSRHQFGSDKDVFAPRFSKNLQQTFVNLYQCPPEDKSKIIRVLNLWQKNNVFQPEVIQPLFDLADPNNPIYKELENSAQQQQQQSANGLNSSTGSIMKGSPALQRTPTKGNQPGNDSVHGATPNLNFSDPNVIQQLQQLQRLISKNVETTRAEQQVHFDRKLLDYDYGDDEDEMHPSPRPQQNSNESILPVTSLLTNPEVLRQLQTLQQTMASASQPQEVDVDKMRKLQEMKQQEDEFDKHLAQTVPNLPFASECDFRTNPHQPMGGIYYADSLNPPAPNYQQTEYLPPPPPQPPLIAGQDDSGEVEVINLDNDDSPDDKYRKRRRSRSRSKDRRGRGERERDRKRSRSRSGSRRYRSRSRDRNDKGKGKDKREDKERETEKDKERKKRGLPVLKRDHLSVCSTTLWVGHLSKLVHQDDLSNTFGEFGDVVSIDLIPPRGCAFIVMLRRQDAARCLAKLKGHVLHGKAITLAWAPGKGVKGKDLKDYWEGDLGVSYVPFNKIKEDIDLDLLEDGGMIDEDTMPGWMREKVERMGKKSVDVPGYMSNAPGQIDTSQPPPMPTAGMLQPPPMMPMVSPFQFNNRMMGMNMPPGMMHNMPNLQNIPLGVPPPSMGGMMANQLMGIGSPFQGPPGMLPPQMPPSDGKPSTVSTEASLHNLGKSLMSLTQSFGMVQEPPAPHDDVMDVEMEDAEKTAEKPPAAAFGEQQGGGPGRGEERKERREERDRRMRSRDRDRDRGERDRGGRGNQDRDRDGRKESRGRDRDRRDGGGRRDRNDRWSNGERDREARSDRRAEGRDAPEAREERRDREKTLNDRLREMAGMGGGDEGSRDRNRDRSFRDRRDNSSRFDNDSRSGGTMRGQSARDNFPKASGELNDRSDRQKDKPPADNSAKPEGQPENVQEAVITLNDEPSDAVVQLDNGASNENAEAPAEETQGEEKPLIFEPPGLFDGPPERFDGPPDRFNGPPEMFDGPPEMFDGPPDRFEGPPGRMFDGPPDRMYDGPPDGMFDGPPDRMFGGPPDRMMFDGPPDLFDGPPRPWGRGRGRRGGRMDLMEGGPPRDHMDGGPPMHFRGRRDFGGRGGMRGPPPDGEFFGRDEFGPPMMMRGARGHRGGRGQFFAPRGRGRGQFRDGPNFNPRFDGPPFDGPPFRGGPGPRMHPPFGDGPPIRFRGAPPPAFDEGGGGDERGPAPSRDGRRSRWAAQSPSQHDDGGGEMAVAPGDEGGDVGETFDGERGDMGGDGGDVGGEGGETGGAFVEEGVERSGREEVSTPVADERSSPHHEADGAAAESDLGAEPSAE